MKKIVFLFVLSLAVFSRFAFLSQNPPSLNWDEVSHGYNAYSILKTGQDEWGKSFPLIFKAYGDYKLPVYIYLTAISEAIFGLNAFAVRVVSALSGVLTVIFSFFLFRKLLLKLMPKTDDFWAFLPSLLLALSSWHIFLSRAAFEANLALFFVVSGIFFFLKGLEKKNFFLLSSLFLGLSINTYNSARIFVFLILAFLFVLYRKNILKIFKKRKFELILSLGLFLGLTVPFALSVFSGEGRARFEWVSIIDQGVINRINMARGESDLPFILPTLLHNKATYFTSGFVKNIGLNLSPKYLFFEGGTNYQYNIPSTGVLYSFNLLFLIVGLLWLLKFFKKKEAKLILFWWLLALVPAAATRDNPHVLRTILVLPMPQIITSLGLILVFKWIFEKFGVKKKLLLIFYISFLFLFSGQFLHSYFTTYRTDYSWSWQYGNKEMALLIKENYNEYDKIFISKKHGEPHEFILFYTKWDPEDFRNDSQLSRYFKTDWYWVDSFGKLIFVNDWEIKEKVQCEEEASCLLVSSFNNHPSGWNKIDEIAFLNKSLAFKIFEKK